MVVAVISPNSEAQEVIAKALERTGRVEAVWSLPAYPEPSQLKDLPRIPTGASCFWISRTPRAATAIAAAAGALSGNVHQIVAMTPEGDAAIGNLARLGIRHVIGLPPATHGRDIGYSPKSIQSRSLRAGRSGSGRIFAFLPAKPGAGATTLAVHTAAAVARLSGERTLLMDFDFRLGMTSFLLKLPGGHSVVDALNDIDRVDLRWDSLINPPRASWTFWARLRRSLRKPNLEQRTALLLSFARKRYQTVVLDLPGEMRDYEFDALRRATNCFLVCNSDIGVMHMAQRKSELLHSLVLEEKTSVIVNRAGGLGMISPRDVEAILRLPVRFSVANAYREIAEATRAASMLEGRGGVIAQIENIARWMLPQAQPARAGLSRRRERRPQIP